MNGTGKLHWHIARKNVLTGNLTEEHFGRHTSSDKWKNMFVKLNFKDTLCGGAR
jgi:hypothetical protein